ncbi:hypothetical protein AC579_2323 [Pseudocercospora musae]|uniref:Uncharacterized protein n=1 Tax=Pseudocercospora musae TaxID=113226 RepID=A0A139I7U1_9PEZI|nr:hypothetical protein AC579_2323 [Pseudocercospora musae]
MMAENFRDTDLSWVRETGDWNLELDYTTAKLAIACQSRATSDHAHCNALWSCCPHSHIHKFGTFGTFGALKCLLLL